MACVEMYLCSNPEDFVIEREVLHQTVFPRLREHCRSTHGVEFRVIDPYEEANPKHWPTQQERWRILQGLRKSSLGPFFVGLVGEQYGDACLPEWIEVSEFQDILLASQRMGFGTDVLERCFQRDENAIPPSVFLCAASGKLKETSIQKNPVKGMSWCKVQEQKVRRILHDVVQQCLEEGTMTHGKAQKYLQSALENDIRSACECNPSGDIARCLCYVHKICIPGKEKDDVQNRRISNLREHYLPSLVTAHKAMVYCTTTKCNRLQGYTHEMRLNYAAGLSEQIFDDLKRLINQTASNKRLVGVEKSGQKDLCQVFSSLYRIERRENEHVRSYLQAENTKFPFILSGRPGMGKTVLLAHCAIQASVWLKNLDPEILVYFIDVNISFKQILKDICECEDARDTCDTDFQLKERFKRLLTEGSQSKNLLVLIIDALDRLPKSDGQPDLTWLPEHIASNVKLLVSISADNPKLLTALKRCYPDSSLFCDLQPVESKRCSQQLTKLLAESDRKITSGQQAFVNVALKKSSLPLYVDLLRPQAVHWTSEFEITKESLNQDIHNNIAMLFDHLERKHGKIVVAKALSYITLTRYGITRAELTDVLSCDDEVLASFLATGNALPSSRRVPEVLVESFLLDLNGFVVLRNYYGSQTLFWVNRCFSSVVCKQYLRSERSRQIVHHVLSDYFSGSWANATAKPLNIEEDVKISWHLDIPVKLYIDRQLPSQPFLIATNPNFRKLLTLPFHLWESGRIDELGNQLMSQDFLQVMSQAKLTDDLFLWLERTSQLVFQRELKFLCTLLRSSTCLLKSNPEDLPTALQAKVHCFRSVLPSLVDRVNTTSKLKVVHFGLTTVLPSVPSVPCSSCTVQESEGSLITHSAASSCGTLVVVLGNGTAMFCDGGTFERIEVTKLTSLQFRSVCSSGDTFLLSTHCGRFLLWDTDVKAEPVEIRTKLRQNNSSRLPEGVLVSGEKLVVWWRGCNAASVVVEEEELTQLPCDYEITCVMGSGESGIVFCGQKGSSVSVFSLQNNQMLATFTCPEEKPVIEMIVSKGGEILTCVDQVGNLFAWNLEIISEPVLIIENHCQVQEKVFNTDYKGENVLLICKRKQIQIVDVRHIEDLDKFNSPRGKTFRQAILDQTSRLVLALLSDCSFVLVWSCASGQCVLSLDTADINDVRHLNCGTSYLAAVTSTSVFFWDVDVTTLSALAPKSGKRVKMLAVASHGEWCYSADGSELVWKWVVLSGKVESQFLHQGTVESMCVSEDGSYLTSIAKKDIYVWQTCNGQNTYRISGSQANVVFVTPKGNAAVAMSETGASRVWKLQSGHQVCSIHIHLRNAAITAEGTFLLGLSNGNLVGANLWSGHVSRCFSSADQADVVAFHSLLDYPDYVIVALASGALFTWRLTEDTTCHQIQLPYSCLCEPEIFRVSSDGGYAIISFSESTINIVDFSKSQLQSLRTEGPVVEPFVSISACGPYAVYACFSSAVCHNSSCDLHKKPMLVAVRLTDGKTLGRVYLCKTPSTLTLSRDLLVFVGFDDGSFGVYAVVDKMMGSTSWKEYKQQPTLLHSVDEQLIWTPLRKPNITWIELPL